MPSIVTHHLFAKDIENHIKKQINKNCYYIFAQSFDNLFYYKFFIPIFGKKIRKLGNDGQQTQINEYFKNIFRFIKENHLEKNEDLLGYLYGSICHFALDSIAHPYIIYETGLVSIHKKYRGGHEKMEVMIDAILYEEHTSIPLRKTKLANQLLPKINFSKELKNGISYSFLNTFHVKNMGKIYEKSYKTGNTILRYFVTDRYGIKKKLYQFIDLFSRKRMYQYLSFYIPNLDYGFLNDEHHIWHYPTNKQISKNASFKELYEQAKQKAITLIFKSNQYLENKISLEEVLKELNNISYATGLNWKSNSPMQFFKF